MLSGLSHDPALRDVFAPLWLGATLCIPDPADSDDPARLIGWMKAITVAHLTPAMVGVAKGGAAPTPAGEEHIDKNA